MHTRVLSRRYRKLPAIRTERLSWEHDSLLASMIESGVWHAVPGSVQSYRFLGMLRSRLYHHIRSAVKIPQKAKLETRTNVRKNTVYFRVKL